MIDLHTLEVLEYDNAKRLVASHATSPLGRERIAQAAPSADLDGLTHEHASLAELVGLVTFDETVPMQGIKDVRGAVRKAAIAGNVLQAQDLVDFLQVLRASRLLHEYFSRRKEQSPHLAGWASQLFVSRDLEAELDATVDVEGSVKDSASGQLRQIRRQVQHARSSLRQRLESIVASLSTETLQEDFITIRDGRYVIPVRESHKSRVAGVIHDRSASGQTVFIEPLETLELNNAIRELEIAEKREVERILRELTAKIGEASDQIATSLEVLGRLDATYAKALYAREYGASVPRLNADGRTVLRDGRHPLLVEHHKAEPGRVVPLSLQLGDGFNSLVITGPNAGGKTVALKTVGLLTLMAQSGFPVLAHPDSEFGVFEHVFADIGDEQSIENELSTFASHVKHLTQICEQSDGRTLVLLDEIGGSTDPEQGAALAMSVIEKLTRQGTRLVATTHHGALKAFVNELDAADNASMQFDLGSLEPTFKLRLGVPGSSYAFQIARRLGLDAEIVASAEARTGDQSRQLEGLLDTLASQVETYEQKSRETDQLHQEAQRAAKDYQEKLKHVKQEIRRLRQEALEESTHIIQKANAVIEKAVADIKKQQASSEAVKAAHKAVKETAEQIEHQIAAMATPTTGGVTDVSVGDWVRVESIGQEGRVCSPKDASGRVEVQLEGVKAKAPLSDLTKLEGPMPSAKKTAYAANVPSHGAVSPEIDLRGMTFDEAAPVLDKYLDDLYLARLEQATIIHGKGTGALRQKISAYLKDHPRVESQRFGDWNEGGLGVTIVRIGL